MRVARTRHLVLAGMLLGCGDGTPAAPPASRPFVCGDTISDDYVDGGIAKQSAAAMFKVSIAAATPAPPARGHNAWTLALVSKSSAPMRVDALRVKAWRPGDSDGANAPWHTCLALPEQGRYRFGPISLPTPGAWTFLVEARVSGVVDQAQINVCVGEGAAPADGGIRDASTSRSDASVDGGVMPACEVAGITQCPDPPLRYGDIAPIIAARCLSCHDGTREFWPLTTYGHVADWNVELQGAMLTCSMPPPEEMIPMTLAEREKILSWIQCGFPE